MEQVTYTATRSHEWDSGHRVYGHQGKCQRLHGHRYEATFICTAEALDALSMVIDFSVIKERLCVWIDQEWDHRCLLFNEDPLLAVVGEADKSVVGVPFNPTAEAIAGYLLMTVGPTQLKGTGVTLVKVIVNETRKCAAEASL